MSITGPAPTQQDRADVELRLPVDSAYVSVLRTTTAGLAARLDFPIDDIEDLRIAVGEASAMVLPEADEAGDLVCRYYMRPGELTVRVSVTSTRPTSQPDVDSFGWQVLSTLASSVRADSGNGYFTIELTLVPGQPGSSL